MEYNIEDKRICINNIDFYFIIILKKNVIASLAKGSASILDIIKYTLM